MVADFDSDGILDLAYGCGASGITVYLGKNPNSPVTSYSKNTTYLAVADFNSDGILDMVTDSGDVLLGNGDGTFSSPVQTLNLTNLTQSYYYQSPFVVGDFDDDGHSIWA